MCARAQARDVDGISAHSSGHELVLIGVPKPEVGLGPRTTREPPGDVTLVVAGGPEGLDHLLARLSAALSEGRANGSDQISRIRAELLHHLFDGTDDDPAHGAAPSRVNSGDSAAPRIGQQNRCAVGYLDGERRRGIVSSSGIGFGICPRFGVPCPSRDDGVAMNLPEEQQPVPPDASMMRDRLPLVRTVLQAERGGREEMVRIGQ